MAAAMITAISESKDTVVPIKELAGFMTEYSAWLLGCGATCARIERNVARMASAFGVQSDIMLMPSHVQLSLTSPDGMVRVGMRRIRSCGISFDLNSRLSRLSWEVADGKVGFAGAKEQFDQIKLTSPTSPVRVLLLTSFANASFCRLFGGDIVAMLIVFVATLAGYRLKQIMVGSGKDIRLTFACCSFFSAAVSAAGSIFTLGTTPDIALGTSVLYLIPGVPYINAVSDLFDRHYLCSFSRFADACVLTACIAAGLCAGMYILGLKTF